MKKTISYLFLFFVFLITIVLFTPLRMFEGQINHFLSSRLEFGSVKLSGLDYQLISFNQIKVKQLDFSLKKQNCKIRNLFLRISPIRSSQKKLTIDSIGIDQINCYLSKIDSNSKEKKNNQQEKENLIESLVINKLSIKNANLKYDDIELTDTKILLSELKYQSKEIDLRFDIESSTFKVKKKFFSELKVKGNYSSLSILGDLETKFLEVRSLISKKPFLDIEKIKLSYDSKTNLSGEISINKLILSDWLPKIGKYQLKKGEVSGSLSFYDLVPSTSLYISKAQTNFLLTNLEVSGVNVDTLLKNYIESNENNYLDIAGFLTLGPIGLLVSKTTKISKSIPGVNSGKTTVHKAIAQIEINNNRVKLQEVGGKTKRHTLILKGSINLKNKKIDLKFAPVDKKGCPIFIQKISGTIEKPDIGAMKTFAGNLFSPITDIFKKSKKALTDCDKFYNGTFLK